MKQENKVRRKHSTHYNKADNLEENTDQCRKRLFKICWNEKAGKWKTWNYGMQENMEEYTQTWEGNILRRKQVFRNETQIQLRVDKKWRHLATLLHHHVKDSQQTKLWPHFQSNWTFQHLIRQLSK